MRDGVNVWILKIGLLCCITRQRVAAILKEVQAAILAAAALVNRDGVRLGDFSISLHPECGLLLVKVALRTSFRTAAANSRRKDVNNGTVWPLTRPTAIHWSAANLE